MIWLETYCSCEFLRGPTESFKHFLLFTLLLGVSPKTGWTSLWSQ